MHNHLDSRPCFTAVQADAGGWHVRSEHYGSTRAHARTQEQAVQLAQQMEQACRTSHGGRHFKIGYNVRLPGVRRQTAFR